jgi:hypothetical protein
MRDRMLAERDTARTRLAQATRQWEVTAALGTRRTQERDAAVSERDRLVRERDALSGERDRLARERDAVPEMPNRTTRERDATGREQALQEHALSPAERARPSTAMSERAGAARRPRQPPAPAQPRGSDRAGRRDEPSSTAQSVGPRDAAVVWRTRVLAGAALLVALVTFVVMLAAK